MGCPCWFDGDIYPANISIDLLVCGSHAWRLTKFNKGDSLQYINMHAVYVPTTRVLVTLCSCLVYLAKTCSSDSSGDCLQFSAPISTVGTQYTCLLWQSSSTMLCGHWPEPKPPGSVAYSLFCMCNLVCFHDRCSLR